MAEPDIKTGYISLMINISEKTVPVSDITDHIDYKHLGKDMKVYTQ